MKFIFKSTLLAILLISANSVYASNTQTQALERIQINDQGTVYFRPLGLGGWGASDCPEARYAYIGKSAPAFENILSLAVAAKLNGSKVRFNGTCNDQGTYFLITYMYLM